MLDAKDLGPQTHAGVSVDEPGVPVITQILLPYLWLSCFLIGSVRSYVCLLTPSHFLY